MDHLHWISFAILWNFIEFLFLSLILYFNFSLLNLTVRNQQENPNFMANVSFHTCWIYSFLCNVILHIGVPQGSIVGPQPLWQWCSRGLAPGYRGDLVVERSGVQSTCNYLMMAVMGRHPAVTTAHHSPYLFCHATPVLVTENNPAK